MRKKRDISSHNNLITISILLLLSLFLSSCYSDYGLTESEYDIVGTAYNESFNFSSVSTYGITDSVYHIIEDEDDIDYTYDAVILSEIEKNMNARGFEKMENISDQNIPDVMLVVAVTSTTHKGGVYYPPGWGYYPGWGYPGYGWGYPPYYQSYTFTKGSIIIQMNDVKNPTTSDETFNNVWFAGINGLLESKPASISSRIIDNIFQAFDQSPYLIKD